MRSILEQAVLHHLNGEDARAAELFHQFIVARARQIHESMRNGDDALVENWEEAVSEEFMTNEDLNLAELEDEHGEEDLDAADEDAALGQEDLDDAEELDDDAADDFAAADEEAGDVDADDVQDELDDHEADDDDMADEIDALKAELEALTKEFDDLKAEVGGDDAGDEGDDFGAEDTGDDFGGEETGDEGEGDDAPFQDMAEGVQDLEPVSDHWPNQKSDGKEVGKGGSISGGSRRSLIPGNHNLDRLGGKPIPVGKGGHKGFERETAPSVASMKPRKNNVPSTNAALSSVSNKADKVDGKEGPAGGKSVGKKVPSPLPRQGKK